MDAPPIEADPLRLGALTGDAFRFVKKRGGMVGAIPMGGTPPKQRR